jgi:hypothetical protein
MPARAVERDRQVQGGGVRGHSFTPNPSIEIGIIEISSQPQSYSDISMN